MFLSKRGKIYYIYFDKDGKRQKISTGKKNRADASKFMQEFIATSPEKPNKSTRPRKKLSDFITEFKEYSSSLHSGKTTKTYISDLNQLMLHTGDVSLNKISIKDVELFLVKKRKESSSQSAARCHRSLSSCFNTAVRWKYLKENIFLKIEKPKTPDTTIPYFTRNDFNKLLSVIDDQDFKELVIFAVLTGMRGGEIRNLHWQDVDLTLRVVHVRNTETFNTKNKRNRIIPLNNELWRILNNRRDIAKCEYVFHHRMKRIDEYWLSKTFKECVRKAKLDDKLNFHSTRHTFGTWMMQAGVPIRDVQTLLGHREITTTQKYLHTASEGLAGAVNKLAFSNN